MSLKQLLAALALLAPLAALPAPNQVIEEATVIWKDLRCDFFILQTPSGYTLFEWMSGPKPNDGDTFEGPMEGFGPRNLINKSAENQVTLAYTEVHSTSKKWVGNKIPPFCKRKKDFLAQVERERGGQTPAPPQTQDAQPAPATPQQEPQPASQ
jgi:hypothetical protein